MPNKKPTTEEKAQLVPGTNHPRIRSTGFHAWMDRTFRRLFHKDDMHTFTPEPSPAPSPERTPDHSPEMPRRFV